MYRMVTLAGSLNCSTIAITKRSASKPDNIAKHSVKLVATIIVQQALANLVPILLASIIQTSRGSKNTTKLSNVAPYYWRLAQGNRKREGEGKSGSIREQL